MNLYNATVSLTYKLSGAIVSLGCYDYKERTSGGGIIPENQRLFVSKKPEYSECYKRVELNEKFVNWAISDEARPEKESNYKAFTFWLKMNDFERLLYHIIQYVRNFSDKEFTYHINEY